MHLVIYWNEYGKAYVGGTFMERSSADRFASMIVSGNDGDGRMGVGAAIVPVIALATCDDDASEPVAVYED